MASFHSASFPGSLAIAKEASLAIGTIDEIQKLHMRTVPLREQPRRIAHQEASKSFAVLTLARAPGACCYCVCVVCLCFCVVGIVGESLVRGLYGAGSESEMLWLVNTPDERRERVGERGLCR